MLTVNGRSRTVETDPAMPLLWVLRDRLLLFGTKYGCGVGVCGACTVLEDGRAVRSCTITIAEAAGRRYTTIEGLSQDGSHPCQRAWLEEDVAQCGFCQPGMILETAALLRSSSNPSDAQIEGALSSHVCRCGTYDRLRRAVRRAARASGGR
jgi:aerobic-type carbon monoxide dehydrogenase small subunit (CoxS/CutS family)